MGAPGERMAAAIVPHGRGFPADPWPGGRILIEPGPYARAGRVHRMVLLLRAVRLTNCSLARSGRIGMRCYPVLRHARGNSTPGQLCYGDVARLWHTRDITIV